MIADDELRIRVADVRRNARIVGVEVRDPAGRRVDQQSARFYFQGGGTVGPVRRSGASQGGAERGGREKGRRDEQEDHGGDEQCCGVTEASRTPVTAHRAARLMHRDHALMLIQAVLRLRSLRHRDEKDADDDDDGI